MTYTDPDYLAEPTAEEIKRQRDFLLEEMRRIAASDPNHSQFAVLVVATAKEAAQFVGARLI